MQLDDITISRAIIESFMKDFQKAMDVEVAIGGAGPAGMTAAYYLAKEGVKTVVFEKNLRPGGGMPGGGMMFNTIVVQEEAKGILNEFNVRTKEYEKGYYTADSVEASSAICFKAIQAGAKIFNLMSIEDVMIRERQDSRFGIELECCYFSRIACRPLIHTVKAGNRCYRPCQ